MRLTLTVCRVRWISWYNASGRQKQGSVLFVQNNFYYDAFFLNAIGERRMWQAVTAISSYVA